MRQLVLTFSIIAALAGGGCGSSSSTMAASAPTPTLVAIRISGEWTYTDPQHIRLTAVGSFSDQTTQILPTGLITWQSSDVDVATVSGLGMVTVLTNVNTDVTGTYQGKTGSV